VNEYDIADCSITISNGWYGPDNDGAWRPRILTGNTCPWLTFEVTFFMSVGEWGIVKHYYTDYDSEGKKTKDSIMKECKVKADDSTQMGCTFLVGKVPASYGVGTYQPMAAFVGGPWADGITSYSYSMYQ